MKRTYNRNITKALMGLATAILLSCSAETDIASSPINKVDEDGALSIRFDAGNTTTRSIKGNDEDNENTVNRLDLFVEINKTFVHRSLVITKTTKNNTITYSATGDGEIDGTGTTWKTVTGLTKDNVKGNDVYLVANWDETKAKTITNIDELKKVLINPSEFNPSKTQTSFVMDGVITATTDGTSPTLTQDNDHEWTLKTIDLKRALAKIRLTVLMEVKGDNSSESERTVKDVTKDVAYLLSNYSSDGTVIAENSELFAEGNTEYNSKKNTLTDYPKELTADVTYLATSDMLTGDNLKIETIKDNRTVSYNGETYSLNKDGNGYNAVVFYCYSNDWIDYSKAYTKDDNGNINTSSINTNIYTEKPILTDRQTMIYVKTAYDGSNKYFYKVPVNYELPQFSDVAISSWTDKQKENFRNLYRIQRNHIYDVVAFIDRQGGQDGIYVQNLVSDWQSGGTYTVSDVSAEMTGTVGTIKLTDTKADQNAIKIAYSSTEKASYSPQLTLNITKLDKDDNGNERSWIIQTDNPNFEFIKGNETTTSAQITGSGTGNVSFRLVPKYDIPTDISNYNRTARVYLTVQSGGTVKVPLTTSLPYDIKTFEVVFYQVAASDYTTNE